MEAGEGDARVSAPSTAATESSKQGEKSQAEENALANGVSTSDTEPAAHSPAEMPSDNNTQTESGSDAQESKTVQQLLEELEGQLSQAMTLNEDKSKYSRGSDRW